MLEQDHGLGLESQPKNKPLQGILSNIVSTAQEIQRREFPGVCDGLTLAGCQVPTKLLYHSLTWWAGNAAKACGPS